MKSFFENIGWKVLCVPETATVLLSSGVLFYDFDDETRINFQENLLKTLLQIEDTINETAKYYVNEKHQNCMIIYDRGAMDPVACTCYSSFFNLFSYLLFFFNLKFFHLVLSAEEWDLLKQRNPAWNDVLCELQLLEKKTHFTDFLLFRSIDRRWI